MKKIIFFWVPLSSLLLSACYAQSMHLEENTPWGPEQQGLSIKLASDSSDPLLQTERNLFTRTFGDNPQSSDWVLTLKLDTKIALLQSPFIWGREKAPPRLRMEIQATGVLTHKEKVVQRYAWKEQGDTLPEKENILKARLIERLNAQIYQQLGPRYVYE